MKTETKNPLNAFLDGLQAQRNEIQRVAEATEADLATAEKAEHAAHKAFQSIVGTQGLGQNATGASSAAHARWQAAADHARGLRSTLADLRGQDQSLTGRIEAPTRAATLRDATCEAEKRHATLASEAEAHTARADDMRARLADIEQRIDEMTAEAAETAATTGNIVSPPALAKLQSEAAIARAAADAADNKATVAGEARAALGADLDGMRHSLRFAIAAATAVAAEAALEPILPILARAAAAAGDTDFTVKLDPKMRERALAEAFG